jgi:hypothetical protein
MEELRGGKPRGRVAIKLGDWKASEREAMFEQPLFTTSFN